jgi:hypothetical protein
MDYLELQDHIRYLESLAEADAPTVSCHLDLSSPYRQSFNVQVRAVTVGMRQQERAAFWGTLGRIEVFLDTGLHPETKGVAIFGRGGKTPFFLALQFDAPLPNRVRVGATPETSVLVELRDSLFTPAENGAGVLTLDA